MSTQKKTAVLRSKQIRGKLVDSTKKNSSARKMSEEILFDCLHAEIVNYCLDSNKVKVDSY